MRKLERIAVLDQQAASLRADNEQLAKIAEKLRSQVYSLKQELRWHVNNGCKVARADFVDSSAAVEVADKATSSEEIFDGFYAVNAGQTGVNPPLQFNNSSENVLASPDSTTMIKKEPIESNTALRQ